MNRRKTQFEEQKSREKQINDIRQDIDTLVSGIRNDITMPLFNLIHIEDRLSTQTDNERINELCMKVQAAVDDISRYTSPHYSDDDLSEIAGEKEKLFASVIERISEPLHDITRSVRQIAYTAADEGIRKDAEMMEAYAELLEYAVKDIFDTISIRTGNLRLNERRFHLSELISDVTFVAKNIADVKELTFECLSDPDTPEFWLGDDIRVRQTVLDFCNNSIRHTTDGIVRLYVSRNNEGGLTFVVSDTGNGTDEDADINGSKLAEGLGGNVRTENVKGRGSEFIIDIPMNEGRQIADADGLLNTEEGLSYYDNDPDEYRQVLLLFYDTAPSYRDSVINDTESSITTVMKSLYRAARSIGAEALSELLVAAIDKGTPGDDFIEIFDETMYRVAGYAGRR